MNKNIKPYLLLALVFIAGIAVGVIGTRFTVRRIIDRVAQNPDIMRQRIEKSLISDLNLTAEQQPKVHEALVRSQEQLRALRMEFQPRFVQIFDKTENEISNLLTPEQQEKYKKILKEKKPMWRPPPLPGRRESPMRP